jgi:hypothetical protein
VASIDYTIRMDFYKFKSPLEGLIQRNSLTMHEVESLWKNYQVIENYWFQNFKNLKKVNLILLGEAPLRHSSYIYNKESADSSFLYKKHLLKCMEIGDGNDQYYLEKNKIELMLELGILALDLFPFSFSMENNFNYRNKDKSNRTFIKPNKEHKKILIDLFNQSYPWHLDNKIDAILKKTSKNTKYAYRYKACANLNLEIFPRATKLSLGKSYDLDKDVLYSIFKDKRREF